MCIRDSHKFICCVVEKSEDPFVPELECVGFFPPLHRKRPQYPFVADAVHRLPPTDGFVPNSVLIPLLFPEKMSAEDEKPEYKTPQFAVLHAEYLNQFNQEVQCKLCSY